MSARIRPLLRPAARPLRRAAARPVVAQPTFWTWATNNPGWAFATTAIMAINIAGFGVRMAETRPGAKVEEHESKTQA